MRPTPTACGLQPYGVRTVIVWMLTTHFLHMRFNKAVDGVVCELALAQVAFLVMVPHA